MLLIASEIRTNIKFNCSFAYFCHHRRLFLSCCTLYNFIDFLSSDFFFDFLSSDFFSIFLSSDFFFDFLSSDFFFDFLSSDFFQIFKFYVVFNFLV